MKSLIKPYALKKGDTVATLSSSWGGAGDTNLRWRYEQGKQQIQEIYGINIVEMPYTLAGTSYTALHPEKRASDLMQAFADPNIKAIISCIGGIDSIYMLPYIDFDVIRNNPKILLGYSDTTISHFICLKAGLSSFYGGALLSDFAENVKVPDYTIETHRRALFSNQTIGEIKSCPSWTSEFLPWDIENKNISRTFHPNHPYERLQGTGTVTGRLIGGCMNVMELMKNTPLFPSLETFEDTILFLETSDSSPSPELFELWMMNYGASGILHKINGLVFGKPFNETNYEEYKHIIVKVLKMYQLETLPVLYNLSFGHCEPKCCIPMGAMAKINCESISFSILESGVL